LRLVGPASVAPGTQLDVLVTVRNEIDAHNLPTGTTFMRQLWLEVVATDATGRVLYSTGELDSNGDLKNHFSAVEPYADHDLVTFGARLTNGAEEPELFPWRATEISTTALSPLYQRTLTFFVPVPADATSPVHVSGRLRFRSHPPFLLKALGLGALLPRLEIFEVAAQTLDVELK
jgi:hypothetical protein